MFEHIGVSNFATYFDAVRRLLKPGGLYLHHAITRPGKRAAVKGGRKRPEFAALTRYIFPGGELDYLGRTIANLELHGFEVHDVEGWREHYQRTCRLWHDRLRARTTRPAREVGEAKTRVWLAYLASCSIVFERGHCGLYQTLCSKRVSGRERPAADAGGLVSAVAGAKVRAAPFCSRARRARPARKRLFSHASSKRNQRGRRPRLQTRPDFCPLT